MNVDPLPKEELPSVSAYQLTVLLNDVNVNDAGET